MLVDVEPMCMRNLAELLDVVWVCLAAETEALIKTAVSHCVAISGRHKASYTRLYNVYIGCCLLCAC